MKETPQLVIDRRVAEVMAKAKGGSSSSDPLVHIAWLIHGLDLWHRSGGSCGNTRDETVRYVLCNVLRLDSEPDERRERGARKSN